MASTIRQMSGHRGMEERPEVADLTDDELLDRVTQARKQLAEAKVRSDQAIVDCMIRGVDQSLIAKKAGITRRALFGVSDRVWERLHSQVQ